MIELIKRVVAEVLNLQAKTQFGLVSSYDPATYSIKALLQPENVETGWIPLAAAWAGNNLGAVFGPPLGTACRIDYVNGSPEAALAGARFFDINHVPPTVQSGQAAIVDAAGSYVRLNGDGTITLSANTSITSTTPILTQNGDMKVVGNVTVTQNVTVDQSVQVTSDIAAGGNITATGDMSDQGGAHGTLGTFRSDYDNHDHTVPQGGTTSTPNLQV